MTQWTLKTLLVATPWLLVACQSNDTPPKPRTNAVTASKDAPTKDTGKKPASTATAKPTAKPARDLCQGQSPLDDPPGELSISRAADGATAPSPVAYGKGRWTWINVWAAWCEPCKKEMPMLLEWQKKLSEKGVSIDLVFVSIDDDQRELDRFLAGQPKDGVRASYWVPARRTRSPSSRPSASRTRPSSPFMPSCRRRARRAASSRAASKTTTTPRC